MEIGLAVPQFGRFAQLSSVLRVARAAESMGLRSLWAGDRLLTPLEPKDRYPGGDGTIPEAHRVFLDPFAVLSVAASATSAVRLGTSALNACWYPPAVLARSLTTIDHLSGGRLEAGLGLGWSSDEYAAAGVPWRGRARRYEATIDALEAIWGTDPVSYEHELWTIPPSHIEPKPVRRPPLHLAGFSEAALSRVGRRGDGWLTAALPIPALTSMWRTVCRAAEQAGRDPAGLRMILRANPLVTEHGTPPRSGTVAEIAAYLAAAAEAGVHEVILDLQHTATSDEHLLDLAAAFQAELAGRRGPT
ncbi:TIGR03619 family F420-dependent LLM class oxidoreductase [Nonomuraea gerenzanensis]|uniref:Luciferase-like monooxygenase superfamily n=1 Tax=Nonomuraea gerenzanensis TaxID=93944 RepID=A0A1M4E1T9_9ACTN|nr:TIGR03619 family F420-dependent LLM class oxidoreductase [Nonomuraea gerenzanensis]UBU15062.1 TIGR03619 family F420-dependent LLM class oxidoreductase [Nonomuraea gerenzanensis]SBO92807.1 Luciferase-like monooxygenase superfamily [Nonomuraea gerenzanensis]